MARIALSQLSTATGKNNTLVITWERLLKQLNRPGRADQVTKFLNKFKHIEIRGAKAGLNIPIKALEAKLETLLKLKPGQGLAVTVNAEGATSSQLSAVAKLSPHINTVTNLVIDSRTSPTDLATLLPKATGARVNATGMTTEQLQAVAAKIGNVAVSALSGQLNVTGLTETETNALQSKTAGESPTVIAGQQASAEMLIDMDADTRAVVDATGVIRITGTASDVAKTISASGIDTAANVAVTLEAGIATADDLNTINAGTTTTVDATQITAVTGSAAAIAIVLSAPGIDMAPDVAVTISAGPAAATDLNTIDSNTSAVVDALLVSEITGTAAAIASAISSAGIDAAANVGVTVAAGIVAAADLMIIDSNTSAVINAASVATLTGTATAIVSAITSSGIDTAADVGVTVAAGSASATDLNTIDGNTRAVVDALLVNAITGAAAEVATVLSAAGINTAADVTATLAAGTATAADLNSIDSNTSALVNALLVDHITGTAAAIASAISSAGINTAADVDVTLAAGIATATDLSTIDGNTRAVVDALLVSEITGTAAAIASAISSTEIDTAANVGVTVAAGTAAAADLMTIDSNTGAVINAASVSTLTGTAASVASVMSAASIDTAANVGVTLESGAAVASDLNTIDGNTRAVVDALLVSDITGTAAEVATALSAAGISTAADVNVTLAAGAVAATELNTIDSNTTAVVDALLVNTITGTAAKIARVISSGNIDTASDVSVSIEPGPAEASDLMIISANTTGPIDATQVTNLQGTASEVEAILGNINIGRAGNIAVTVTDVGAGLASVLKSIDASTTTIVDASGITTLHGNYAHVEAVRTVERTGAVTLGNGYSVNIEDAASVLNGKTGNYTGTNDVLAVGAGAADLRGLQGFEHITLAGGGHVHIADGNGTDVSAAAATSGVDVVLGDGPSRGQTFHGSQFADTVMGGIGTDVFVYASDAELQVAEIINGGAGGFDTIRLDAGGTYDFRGVNNVDRLAVNADGISVSLNDGFNGDNGVVEIYNDTGSDMYTGVRIDASAFTGGIAGINVASAAGNDFAGDDTMIGGDGADTLLGGGGMDSLIGHAGNDIFVYRDAAELIDGETVDGGIGNDVIRIDAAGSYDFAAGVVRNIDQVSLNDNSGSISLTLGDDFNNNGTVEITNGTGGPITQSTYIDGSAFIGDTLRIDATAHLDGDDSIQSGTGDDTIHAGKGLDTIESSAGNDTINAGDDNDTVRFASSTFDSNDSVDGGKGTEDWIEITDDATVVDADFTHVKNAEVLYLDGTAAQQVTLGTLADGAGIVEVTSYYGNASTIDIGATTIGKRVWTQGGADTITAGNGDDTLYANEGDDLILFTSAGLDGSDVVDAGEGDDTLRVTDVAATVEASDFSAVYSVKTLELTGTGTHKVTLDGSADSAELVEVIARAGTGSTIDIGDTSGDISVMTDDGQDDITAGSGNNTIKTGKGNDRISFLSDAFDSSDTVDGGDGSNEIRFLDDATVEDSDFTHVTNIKRLQLEGADSQNVTLGLEANRAGIDQIWATAGNSSTIDLGSSDPDNDVDAMTNGVEIRTDGGNDLIYGGKGKDTVFAGQGDDTLSGWAGEDSLQGEDGDDVFLVHEAAHHTANEAIIGGNGSDEIRFTSTKDQTLTLTAGVAVEIAVISDAAGDQTGTSNESIDATAALGNIELEGNKGNNTLTGNGGDNTIHGEDGDDTLLGAAGNDSVTGGAGNDSMTGGAGDDTLDGGEGADTFVVEQVADLTANDEIIGGDNDGGVDTLKLKDAGLYDFRDAVGNLKLDGVEAINLDANNGLPTAPFHWRIALDDNAVNNATAQTVTIAANVAQTQGVMVLASDILSPDLKIVVKGTNMNGNDLFVGGAGDDTLSGGDGGDGIDGAGGDDVISGDGGADHLYGHDGDDTFIFVDAEFGLDTTVDGGNDTDTLQITDDASLADSDFTPVHDVEKLELKGMRVQTVELGTHAGAGFNDVTILVDTKAAGLNLDASNIGASDKVTVTATINADTLKGGAGDDSLAGGDGDDTLLGAAGNDSVTGGGGDDSITGGAGDDTVDGGDGADTFVVELVADLTANDEVIGGDNDGGVDTLKLKAAGLYDFRDGTGFGNLKLDGVEEISLAADGASSQWQIYLDDDAVINASDQTLTIKADVAQTHGVQVDASTILSPDLAIVVKGDNMDSNDSFVGGAGEDILKGGKGNDTLRGGDNNDSLDGGAGNDVVDGGADDDILFGGEGNDTLVAGSGNDRIGTDGPGIGNEFGDDVIQFNSAEFDWQDTVDGGSDDFADSNTLEIVDDATVINDDFKNVRDVQTLLLSGTGRQEVTLGEEADKAGLHTIDARHGNGSVIDITATRNNITVLTDAGNDTITGGAGNNSIESGAGDDRIDGREGADTIVSGTGNDSIEGYEGADSLDAGSGDDTVSGERGADTLLGGAGNDTFVYRWSSIELASGESIDGGAGDTDVIVLGAIFSDENGKSDWDFTKASVSNIEKVDVDINRASTLTLGDNFNTHGGTVEIANTTGAAITENMVIDASRFVGDSLNISATDFNGNDAITGGNAADTLNGGAGADTIIGGEGQDSLVGGAGNDVFLIGSAAEHAANEVLSGGDGTDVIRFTTTQNGDILILNSTVTGIEEVRMTDALGDDSGTTGAKIEASSVIGAIDLYGNAGGNMLRGNASANVIAGGKGDDWIDTGAGNDRVVHNVGDGVDTIADFNVTADVFDTNFVSSVGNYNFRTYTAVQTNAYRSAPLTLATQGAGIEGIIEFQDNFDNNAIDFTDIKDVIDSISNGNLAVSSAGGKTLLLLNDLDGGAMSVGASTPDLVDSYLYEVNDINSDTVVTANEITLVGVFNNVGGTGAGALSIGDIS